MELQNLPNRPHKLNCQLLPPRETASCEYRWVAALGPWAARLIDVVVQPAVVLQARSAVNPSKPTIAALFTTYGRPSPVPTSDLASEEELAAASRCVV